MLDHYYCYQQSLTTAVGHDGTCVTTWWGGSLLMVAGALIVEIQVHMQTVQQSDENYA